MDEVIIGEENEMKREILTTTDLTVGYGKKAVIDGITVTIEPGEILTVIGPNGSGKTTMLRTITQNLEPIDGEVEIADQKLKKISKAELARQVAIVFTEKIDVDYMTCQDVVEMGRYPYTGKMGFLDEEDKKKVKSVMERFQLEEIADKEYSKVSDGQRQRVMIARAVCQDPAMIVLDEPTTFLDIHYKLELLDYLKTLAKEENVGILLSLHELELVRRVSDKVLCVKNQKVFLYDTTERVMTQKNMEELYSMESGKLEFMF